jgi:hypothetical protein
MGVFGKDDASRWMGGNLTKSGFSRRRSFLGFAPLFCPFIAWNGFSNSP